jgi:hypothetical protein
MRFVWQTLSNDKNGKRIAENATKPPELLVQTEQPEKPPMIMGQLELLNDYHDKLKKLKEDSAQSRDFLGKSVQWGENGNYEEFRRAGISKKDDTNDRFEKHALLSSLLLTRLEKEYPNEPVYMFNSSGNRTAEDHVGAGDCFPANVKKISIKPKGDDEFSEVAVRAINPANNRIGYYLESDLKQGIYTYAPLFTGTEVKIVEILPDSDPWVQKMIKGEHEVLYPEKKPKYKETRTEVQAAGFFEEVDDEDILVTKTPTRKRVRKQEPPQTAEFRREDINLLETISPLRKKILASAKASIDPNNPLYKAILKDFGEIDYLRGGKVGCARVVSRIFQAAGIKGFEVPLDSVDGIETKLTELGWKRFSPPEDYRDIPSGAILIWPRLKNKDGSQGNRHVGFASRKKGYSIDNNCEFGPPGPKESDLSLRRNNDDTPRKLQWIFLPPGEEFNPEESRLERAEIPADIDERKALYQPFIEEASERYGVPVELIAACISAESVPWNPEDYSGSKAGGLMQLMPFIKDKNGKSFAIYPPIVVNGHKQLDPRDGRADPRENILAGTKLLSELLKKYNGNVSLAMAAYNAGSGNVDKYGGIPPFEETQKYVKKVLAEYKTRKNQNDSGDNRFV